MAEAVSRSALGTVHDARETGIRRAVVACTLGQMFEVYDFLIFGFFAAQIGRAFYPATDPMVSLLSSLATFGAGFLMRPLGAIVMGSLGDRIGRRATLAISIALMALATGLTGLLPTYATLGVTATVLLVLCRLLQGFSMGGEWGGAATFIAEHAPPGRRGFLSSFQSVGGGLALLAAALTAAILSTALSPEELQAWGWRIPFIIGCLLGPVAYYLRTKVAETPAFVEAVETKTVARSPLWTAIRDHGGMMLAAAGISAIVLTLQYMFAVFMPSYAVQTLKIDQAAALYATAGGALFYIVFTPIVGGISDRVGRRRMVYLCAFLSFVLAYPLFMLLSARPTAGTLFVVQAAANLLQSLMTGVITALLAEMFPTKVRYSALSVSYAAAVIVFGGFAPFIATFLVQSTGDPLSPGYFLMVAAFVSGVAAYFTRSSSPAAKLD